MEKWTDVRLLGAADMKQAQKEAKREGEGKWKWAAAPGNGKTRSVFCCNAHDKCEMLIRVILLDGAYYLQQKGEHNEVINLKRRKNSSLTFEQEAKLIECMDMGGKPAGTLCSMTCAKSKELKEAGENPLNHKKEEGGLIGAIIDASSMLLTVS